MSFIYKISMFDKNNKVINSIINGTLSYPTNTEEYEYFIEYLSDTFHDNSVYTFGNHELEEIDFDKYSKKLDYNDGCWIVTEDLLKGIIENYRAKIEKYYTSLLTDDICLREYGHKYIYPLEIRRINNVKDKLRVFDKHIFDFSVYSKNNNLINSFLWEYEIFNIINFYKNVFNNKQNKLFIIWGS